MVILSHIIGLPHDFNIWSLIVTKLGQLVLGYSRNIHTPPMDDIGNPVENGWWAWLEIHEFPQKFPQKPFKVFQNSGIQDLESARLKSCKNCHCHSWKSCNIYLPKSVSSIGRVNIFWNSPLPIKNFLWVQRYLWRYHFTVFAVLCTCWFQSYCYLFCWNQISMGVNFRLIV